MSSDWPRSLKLQLRLAESRLRQVPAACTRYLDDVADVVQQTVANVTLRHHRRQNSTSVSGLVAAVVDSTVTEAERRVTEYVQELDRQYRRPACLSVGVSLFCVSLSVREHVSRGNYTSKLHRIFVDVARGRGSVGVGPAVSTASRPSDDSSSQISP